MSCDLWALGYRVRVKEHLRFLEVERSGVLMKDLTEGTISRIHNDNIIHMVDVYFPSVNATIPFRADELTLDGDV